ncbi:predicted protein [Clavispora lusitaniae ATCC 42720]|uniref:Uncharacterized protein n=1 Tax=Clavispora lusitaniae (strain ATCC 42720) TaxID=306902 RepID=C4Y9H7_CLAL4|nr:uncharacterized protein CLUG_04867 [Clavispora lusitaniae ATCC 42720]EEQ40739.1 predicted protein [Clavispora lusitaniae ATCC 42720]
MAKGRFHGRNQLYLVGRCAHREKSPHHDFFDQGNQKGLDSTWPGADWSRKVSRSFERTCGPFRGTAVRCGNGSFGGYIGHSVSPSHAMGGARERGGTRMSERKRNRNRNRNRTRNRNRNTNTNTNRNTNSRFKTNETENQSLWIRCATSSPRKSPRSFLPPDSRPRASYKALFVCVRLPPCARAPCQCRFGASFAPHSVRRPRRAAPPSRVASRGIAVAAHPEGRLRRARSALARAACGAPRSPRPPPRISFPVRRCHGPERRGARGGPCCSSSFFAFTARPGARISDARACARVEIPTASGQRRGALASGAFPPLSAAFCPVGRVFAIGRALGFGLA